MKLSPGQVREVLDISQETLRHWRDALPPLAGRKGYGPCFTPGDLLALAIVKTLTDEAGIRLGYLQSVAARLFEHCSRMPWTAIERMILIVEPVRTRIEFISDAQIPPINGISIVVRCQPIIATLRERLLLDRAEEGQGNLRFPPTMVSADARRRRAS